MVALTKVQSFAGAVANTNHITFGALAGEFPGNVPHAWMVYFRETVADSGAFQYLVAKCDNAGLGQRVFTDSNGGSARYGLESNGTTSPNRATTTVYTQGQWHCILGLYDGTGVLGSDIKIYHSINGGAFVEATYSASNDGSGSIATDALDALVIGNRPGSLDRPFKGRHAYTARFDLSTTPITSASQVQAIFDNGPLSDARCQFLWANGQDYVGGKTPTSTGSGVSDDTVNLPPNTQLGDAAVPMTSAAAVRVAAQTTLTTSISLASSAVARVLAGTTLTTGEAGMQSAAAVRVTAGSLLSTGIPLQSAARVAVSAGSTLQVDTTTLDANFAGANANTSTSTISGADTSTPLVTIFVRSPDDSEWQQWLFKLNGVAGKTVTIRIKLTGKEDDPDAYLGTWQGPWWSADASAGPSGWTLRPWSQVSGDYMEFTVSPGAAGSIYCASLPPQTETTVLAWIQSLAAAHPTLIHDDVPSRVAFGGAPYVCALSGTGVDENSRSISNRPLYAFRIGNDSIGSFPKRIIEVSSGVHSGEWNGLLQTRGFVNEILTGVHSASLLSRFTFIVRPLHSTKGNYLGFRRNEAASSIVSHADANREWADGDTTLATVVQWQAILDADHGVNHSQKVVGFFDFHDGKNVSQKAWIYQYASQPFITQWAALVAAENGDIATSDLTGTNGTTQQYWTNKGVAFAWTCECADEKSTVAQVEAFGAAYARALIPADNAGYIPQFLTSSARVGVSASSQLTTGIALQSAAAVRVSAGTNLTVPGAFNSAAVVSVRAVSALNTSISMRSAASARVGAGSALQTGITVQSAANASVRASTILGNVVVLSPGRQSPGRSYAVKPNESKRPVIAERKRHA